MPLENLLELVETLRNRITEHGAALRQSEAFTRYALIDPLLRELGWNTEDPALVMPEYRLGKGHADYALLHNGKPVIMVEAKKLGTPLHEAASQGIGYCIEDGIGYFAVTDGGQWEIYETHKMAPIAEKLTVQFDIEQSPPMTCLKAMALWRPAVEYGSIMTAETPIVGLDAIDRYTPKPNPAISQVPTVQGMNDTPVIDQGWISLSEFKPQKHTRPPIEIQFPDYSDTPINHWNTITIEIVRWLFTHEFLNQSNWNIKRNVRYFVSDSKRHSNGSEFKNPHQVGPLWVEGDYTGVDHVKNTCFIIERTGQDPAQFKVRLR